MKNIPYNERVSSYYDQDALGYEQRYWSNSVLQQMRQSFRETVKSYPAGSMLEIGCGTGLDLVHFAKTHPFVTLCGMDISGEMVSLSLDRLAQNGCSEVQVLAGTAGDADRLFLNRKFDLIYVFFGALNTVENLDNAARAISNLLADNGIVVVSYVNKWYLAGMLIDLLRLRFARAFARLKTVWGGYSPTFYLPSHCYTPGQVKHAFNRLKPSRHQGYTILHPAWFYTNINRKLGGRLRRFLWKVDTVLNRTFLWRFGEYGLVVFENR